MSPVEVTAPAPNSSQATPEKPPSIDCGDAIYIPGGRVKAWTGEGSSSKPSTWTGKVEVGAFCIDRTEVTCSEYAACVAEGKCKPVPANGINVPLTIPGDFADSDACDRVCDGPSRDDHPMVCTTWVEAEEFCKYRGGYIPMDYQWYLAASGAGQFDPSEMVPPEISGLSLGGNGGDELDASPVGTHPDDRSRFGVVDLLSNAEEWASTQSTTDSRSTTLHRIGVLSPSGPGAYRNHRVEQFVVSELPRDPTYRYRWLGVRCAYGIGTQVRIERRTNGSNSRRTNQ